MSRAKASEKKGLVPRLRFPEFRHAGGWQETQLSDIADFYKGKGISKADIKSSGTQPCIRYGELYTVYGEVISDVVSKTDVPRSDLFLSHVGDVITPSSGETKIDIATAACVLLENIALGGDINIIRSGQNGVFLSYYMNGALKHEIAKVAQGDTVVHLYISNLKTMAVAIPDFNEQQKIADCLLSIDILIAAQAEKVEALKIHKSGLMQQLFPREDEMKPRFRFPAFLGSGDWSLRKLEEFIIERSEYPIKEVPLYSLTIESGVAPKTERYERSFLVKNEASAYKLVQPDDFAFNPMNLRFGAIAKHAGTEPVAVSKYYNIFYCDSTVDPRFCEIYFSSPPMIAFYDNVATGSLIEKRRVHFSDFLQFSIRFPSLAEQQIIAGCFDFLEVLITTESEKLSALKVHKKGLMQGLFPSPDPVDE